MPTLEDTFHVFLIITDKEYKEVLKAQISVIDNEYYDPIAGFDFESALRLVKDLRETAKYKKDILE